MKSRPIARAKKRLDIDADRYFRLLSEGRGQGTGAAYRPWYQYADVPGKKHNRYRTSSSLTGFRTHHLFDDYEFAAYLDAWVDPTTLDVREHYPMLPLNQTLGIAALLKLKHEVNARTNYPIPQTVDFLITTRTGLVAWTVVGDWEWETKAALSRFAIAEHFWRERNVQLVRVLTSSLTKARTLNQSWVYDGRLNQAEARDAAGLTLLHKFVIGVVSEYPSINSMEVARRVAVQLNVSKIQAIDAVRRVLAERLVVADWNQGSPEKGLILVPRRGE